MARLIDADKLMKAIKTDKIAWRFGVPNTLGLLFDHLRIIIKEQPTVDAVEVVHGRWELHGNDDDCGCSYFCSNCHKSYDEDYFYARGQYIPYHYCPNCGARMDGDGDG